jgi:tRNA pseudouridine13 synthase
MIRSSDDERRMGIEVFYTNGRGIGGKLRKKAEDFVVEEMSSPPSESIEGEYTIARIKVKNWETNRLIRLLSRQLGISRKRIGFAGTKDRRAVTTQLISIKAPFEDVRKLSLRDLEILEVYPSNKGLDLGDLLGNRFEITIRDIKDTDLDTKNSISNNLKELESLKGFPNFFGHQRFGAVRPITHIVGKKITEGDFKGAVHLYLGNPIEIEGQEAFGARRAFDEGRSPADVLKLFPKHLGFERALLNHLIKKEGDYIGALNALPKNLLMMFVHAYQSYIFNRILSRRIEKGLLDSVPLIGDIVLPMDKNGLPDHKKWIDVTEDNIDKIGKRIKENKAAISGLVLGSDVRFAKGEPGEIEKRVVEEERGLPEDFIIPQMRELSSKGIRRELVSPFSDFSYDIGKDGLRTQFSLQKGCYATALLREFMKSDMLSY